MFLKIFILLFTHLLFLLSLSPVWAEDVYFRCLPNTNVIPYNAEFTIKVLYALKNGSEDLLRIKPVSEGILFLVWNTEKGSWVPSTAEWARMPHISSEIKVKVLEPAKRVFELQCEVQDIVRGKVYVTDPVKMWGNYVWREYLRRLGAKIVR